MRQSDDDPTGALCGDCFCSIMRHFLLFFLLLLGFSSCQEESERSYARHHAFLRFQPVVAAPPLYRAVSNAGHWCTLTYDHRYYTIAAPGQASVNFPITALAAYGAPRSIAGFIVGIPQLPDVQGQYLPRAYDLVCPSCYESTFIAHSLILAPVGSDRARCPSCRREYDLATGAPVSAPNDGQKNPYLYRYRCNYSSGHNVLVVQN